jgi:cytosine deaminase
MPPSSSFDLLIRHARLRPRLGELVDIGLSGGHVAAIEAGLPGAAGRELDAQGGLVTESFANPHLHLDKVYTQERLDEATLAHYHAPGMGQAMTAIELAARVKADYRQDWIAANARRAVVAGLRFGNTHLRAFADVDRQARLEAVKALLEVREEFRGRVAVQVVAFPQEGVVREPGAAELVREALELGADVVGGIPWIEYTEAGARQHIEVMFALAQEYNRDVSMLVDDAGDPGLRTLEMLAVKTLEAGWQGRVLAHHARAMALYPSPYLQKVMALLRQAGVALVSDPHTGPLHAPVKELLVGGALVCLGQDDISDAYYPFGRNNMLEVAFLAAHQLWMTTGTEQEQLYDMITRSAARAMGLRDFELRVGAPANLVVLGVPSVLEALRSHEAPRFVISHGRLMEDKDFSSTDPAPDTCPNC